MKTHFLCVLIISLLCGCATTLQEKYSSTTTPQLKLKHTQLAEYLVSEKKGFEFHFGNPLFSKDERPDRIKEKEEIEQELLRRYQSGDKAAYLPIFEDEK